MEQDVGVATVGGLAWRRSRSSGPHGNCIEVAALPDGGIAIRNSRHPGGPTLRYTRAELAAFMSGVRDGEFDDLVTEPTC